MREIYNPSVLALMLSRQCNISCSHCIVDSGPKKRGEELNLEEAKRMIREGSKSKIKKVLVYGG